MVMTISFSDYKPWGGAKQTYNKIEEAGKLKELEEYLEEFFFNGIPTDEEVNDVLWHDDEDIFSALGMEE